jgi:hypothetical protein
MAERLQSTLHWSDLEKLPAGRDHSRSHRIVDQVSERKPELDGELFDLPACETGLAQVRGDPWWDIPAALLMCALVAAGVVMLLSAMFV